MCSSSLVRPGDPIFENLIIILGFFDFSKFVLSLS